MKLITEFERAMWKREREEKLAHKWRVDNWNRSEKLREAWTPMGLTCPGCGADHCQVDGHFCN